MFFILCFITIFIIDYIYVLNLSEIKCEEILSLKFNLFFLMIIFNFYRYNNTNNNIKLYNLSLIP